MEKNLEDLLARYLRGHCTPEERALVHEWYEKIGEHELELSDSEKEAVRARMLAAIQHRLQPAKKVIPMRIRFTPGMLRVAAAVALVMVFGLWLFTQKSGFAIKPEGESQALADEVIIRNEKQDTQEYRLSDGSTVRLDGFASIRFRKDFSVDTREVYLTGRAFFDIVKDTSRPFYVYSGEIGTRVLGTSFFVDAPPDSPKVAIKVVTGTVSVFQIKDPENSEKSSAPGKKWTTNGVVLSPNQKVEYFVDGGHWVTGLVEEPVPVKSIDVESLSFVFSNTPISEVLKDINERFGIEVITANEDISRCSFTGDVSRMALYDMLDVISNSIGSTYEIKGTRILVSGTGCDHASQQVITE